MDDFGAGQHFGGNCAGWKVALRSFGSGARRGVRKNGNDKLSHEYSDLLSADGNVAEPEKLLKIKGHGDEFCLLNLRVC